MPCWRSQKCRSLERAALLTGEQVHEELLDPFIHFHPVCIPYLRYHYDTESNIYDRIRSRYIQYYYEMINDLFHEDFRTPHPVRAVVRKELPNVRKALFLVLQLEDLEAASLMVNSLSLFLTVFGFWHERDEFQRFFAEKRKNAEVHSDNLLTFEAYLYESGLAEAEYENGETNATSVRLGLLLRRIETQPDDAPVKRGSYEHCVVLHLLARCDESCGQFVAAEEMAHRSLDVVDGLLIQRPGDRDFVRQVSAAKTDPGDILREQGRYEQALAAYQDAFQCAEDSADWRQQAVIVGQLGIVSMLQRRYSLAQEYLTAAAGQFHDLAEASEEAVAWHQPGIVADEQAQWPEAERCYRESLTIKDQLADREGVSLTCNQLARIAQKTGHLDEAEYWYRQALESSKQGNQESPLSAQYLNNLASLLLDKARLGPAADHHLSEARAYAEKALAIREHLKNLSEIWMTLPIFADIAQVEGRLEDAQAYALRSREAYADFPGNRYPIQHQFARLIVAIARTATKDLAKREEVEKTLQHIEEKSWHITSAVHRFWAGERDWRSLTEDMESPEALLMLMVLQALEKDVT
jgi:tetratricopeptide (TPR) repeat protein